MINRNTKPSVDTNSDSYIATQNATDDLIKYWLKVFQSPLDINSADRLASSKSLDLEDLWRLMDRVWDEMGCDNINLDSEKISAYYQHPIWLLNGFFIEQHDLSLQHRHAISDWIAQNRIQKVLDFGGGFGTLARMISGKADRAIVDIYEPYPSQESLSLCKDYPRLRFVSDLGGGYECLVSTDVLEHVSDPLDLFTKMIAAVEPDGYLIIANHFYPCIKCHLPSTFHFRYSFGKFAKVMGLEEIGLCQGSHAMIYRKTNKNPLNWEKIRRMEASSRQLYPLREFNTQHLLPWSNRFRRLLTDPIGTLRRARLKFSR